MEITPINRSELSRGTHHRIAEAEHQRVMLAEHRPPRVQGGQRPDPHPEEKAIITAAPGLADYVAELKQWSRKVIPTFPAAELGEMRQRIRPVTNSEFLVSF